MSADSILASFAEIVDYPAADLPARLVACRRLVAPENPEAAALLARFESFVRGTDAGRLEELYAEAFDFLAGCAPHLGAHLFPDDPRRGAFMARLAETYRAHGFSSGAELPDHLGVVLRFLAAHGGNETATELLELAVVPATTALAAELARQAHPWEPVLRALLLVVRARAGSGWASPPAAQPSGPSGPAIPRGRP